jgi:hypothetical protein
MRFAALERRRRLIAGKTGEDEAALLWTIASVAARSAADPPVSSAGVARHIESNTRLE